MLVDIFKLNKKDLLIQRDSDNILEEAVKDLKYPNVILDVAREKLETDGNYFPTNVYEFEKDERFLGTYNWFNADNFMMHTFADVIPYIIWGNTPDDLYGSRTYGWEATPKLKRFHPDLYNTYDFMNIGWINND